MPASAPTDDRMPCWPHSRSALRKLLLFHDHLCCIYSHAVFVRVASGLNTPGYGNPHSLTEILLRKLRGTSEHNTRNKICARLSVPFKSAVNSHCYLATAVAFSPGNISLQDLLSTVLLKLPYSYIPLSAYASCFTHKYLSTLSMMRIRCSTLPGTVLSASKWTK